MRRLLISKKNLRINERIRCKEVRVINEENDQVGVLPTYQALEMAREADLDLVEVSPNAEPPVCRIMDYGKFLYQQKRKEKLSHKKQHTVVLKEIRLRPKIDKHDCDIKVEHAKKFIEKGNKVQFTMQFRGREMTHIDHGYTLMEEILETLGEEAKLERPAQMLGRRMTMVVTPTKT